MVPPYFFFLIAIITTPNVVRQELFFLFVTPINGKMPRLPILLDIKNPDNKIRSKIGTDGSVHNPFGKVVAFINADGSTGDVYVQSKDCCSSQRREETLLGKYGPSGVIYTAFSQVLGKIDEQASKVMDSDGNVLLSVLQDGELRDGAGKTVGTVAPYRPKFFKLVASYFIFLDPALALPGFFSLVCGVKGKGFEVDSTTQYINFSLQLTSRNLLVFYDKYQNIRGRVTTEGEVFGPQDKLLGYLNEDGSAGDAYVHLVLAQLIKVQQRSILG